MKRLILIAFLILIITSNALASTNYVSNTGSATWAASENISTPCSLNTANSYANAGDLVYLRGGYYDGATGSEVAINPSNSGTSGNEIIFRAYATETPVLRYVGVYNATMNTRALIVLHQVDYIKIEGITVRSPDWRWFSAEDCEHILFDDCTFEDVSSETSWSGSHLRNCEYIYFIDCSWDGINVDWAVEFNLLSLIDSIHLLFLRCHIGSAPHDGIGELSGQPANQATYRVFKDCVIENKWHSGVSVSGKGGGQYALFSECTFKNGGSLPSANSPLANGSDPALYLQGRYNIVRYNTFYNNNVSLSLRAGWTGSSDFEYNWIYHNTSYDCPHHNPAGTSPSWYTGNHIFGESATTWGHQYNYIINNIFWKSEDNTQILVYDSTDGLEPSNNTITNNYIGDPVNSSLIRWAPNQQSLAWQDANASDGWANNSSNNPLMTDPDNQDFALQASSPCINAATHLTLTNGTGSASTTLILDDAGPFFSGGGAPWFIDHADIDADTIYIEDTGPVLISSINYSTNTITLTANATWANNSKVWYCPGGVCFAGSAPDIGAYESGISGNTAPYRTAGNPSGNITVYHDISDTFEANCTVIDDEGHNIIHSWTFENCTPPTSTAEDPGTITLNTTSYPEDHAWTHRVSDEHGLYTDYGGTVSHVETTPMANNFAGDYGIIGWWELNDNTDSSGNSNTLDTANGNPTYSGGGVVLDGDDSLERTNLSSNVGDITVASKFKFDAEITATSRIAGEYDSGASDRVWSLFVGDASGVDYVGLSIGHTAGADYSTLFHSSDLVHDTEYLAIATYDTGADDAYLYIYDSAGNVVGSTASDMSLIDAATQNVESTPFLIGATLVSGTPSWHLDGTVYDVALWDRVISANERAAIASDQYPVGIIAEVIGITADGSYGAGGTVNVAIQFQRKVVAGESVPVNVTWTDSALPYAYLLTETGATDLRLYHHYPASGVAGDTHYFRTHTTDANHINSMIASGMNSSDLSISSMTLNGGTFEYGAPAIDCDLTMPSAPDRLEDNADIIIDTIAPTIPTFNHCDVNGDIINTETSYQTGDMVYWSLQSDGDALHFADGPLSNLQMSCALWPSNDALDYHSGMGTAKILFVYDVQSGARILDFVTLGTAEDVGFIHGETTISDLAGNEVVYTLPQVDPAGGNIVVAGEEIWNIGTGETYTDINAWETAVVGVPDDVIDIQNDLTGTQTISSSGAIWHPIIVDGNRHSVDLVVSGDYVTVRRVRRP